MSHCGTAGDTQALPGYVSFYLQLQDPNLISNHRWDCFASYTLAVLNSTDRGADLSRESWHRFSSRPARQQTRCVNLETNMYHGAFPCSKMTQRVLLNLLLHAGTRLSWHDVSLCSWLVQ